MYTTLKTPTAPNCFKVHIYSKRVDFSEYVAGAYYLIKGVHLKCIFLKFIFYNNKINKVYISIYKQKDMQSSSKLRKLKNSIKINV